ncbi:MAG: hypothetical protein Kow00128_10360 [Deltaproteobacteria bacterium]
MTGSARGGRGAGFGSRLLLAAALLLGIAASLYVGARLSDLFVEITGIDSSFIRLGLKVLLMAAALPAGFYLVERFFLCRKKAQGRSCIGK